FIFTADPAVYCKRIEIWLPVGTGEPDLTNDPARITTKASSSDFWDMISSSGEQGQGKFIFETDNPTNKDVTLELRNIAINTEPTTDPTRAAPIKIITHTSPSPGGPSTRTEVTKTVTKFSSDFSFGFLYADDVAVPYEGRTTLHWKATNAECIVHWNNPDGTFGEKNVHDRQEFLTEERDGPGLLKTFTTFRVEAYDGTVGSTRKFGLTTTVICIQPDLTTKNLTTQNLAVNGTTDLRGHTQTRSLDCVDGQSIRTEYLGAPLTAGNPVLVIDRDSAGVDIGGATTFNNTVTVVPGRELRVGTINLTPNSGRTHIVFLSDVWLDEKDLYVKGNIETRKTNANAKGLLKVAGDTTLNGHLTVANVKSIRTKYLRGPVDGDRTLVIDEDETGTEFPGPVKLLSLGSSFWMLVDVWSDPVSCDRLYFSTAGNQKFYVDIARPGGGGLQTVQVDAGRSYWFVVPGGWVYRRREGANALPGYFVNVGRS
ncbi:hypothetical protein ACWCZ5_34240, partial [Streptomyces sp. NPDC001667]